MKTKNFILKIAFILLITAFYSFSLSYGQQSTSVDNDDDNKTNNDSLTVKSDMNDGDNKADNDSLTVKSDMNNNNNDDDKNSKDDKEDDESLEASSFYPNPAESSSTLNFQNKKKSNFSVTLYDSKGNLVQQINNNDNGFKLNVGNLQSGAYYYIISSDVKVLSKGNFQVK